MLLVLKGPQGGEVVRKKGGRKIGKRRSETQSETETKRNVFKEVVVAGGEGGREGFRG